MDNTYLKSILIKYKHLKNQKDKDFDYIDEEDKTKLIYRLLEILEDEAVSFKYDDTNDLTYIFLLLEMYESFIKDNKTLQKNTTNTLKRIHKIIKTKIKERPTDLDKNKKANSRYELLKNIINKMEDIILRIMYSPTDTLDETKNKFVSTLVFEYKNYDLVENAIKNYPHVVNLRTDSTSLIEGVVDNYLLSLKKYLDSSCLDGISDLIYYKDIYKLLRGSEKIRISSQTKKNIVRSIKKFVNENNYDYKLEREKQQYFINYLYSTLDDIDDAYENLSYELDIEEEFNPAVLSEANIFLKRSDNLKSKNNLTIVTFDGIDAVELDDAASITKDGNNYILGVHIADPTELLEDTILIKDEAFKRTRSLYFPDRSASMFPRELAKKFSLDEGCVRKALNYYFTFDISRGDLLNMQIDSEPIKIHKNLTYDDFNTVNVDTYELEELIYNLSLISSILEKYIRRDYLYSSINDELYLSTGEKVVQNSMIFTGYMVSDTFIDKHIPVPFKNHTLTNEIIEKLKNYQERLILLSGDNTYNNNILKNEYPRAYYSPINEGHSGLGLKSYAPVGSPIRRVTDTVTSIGVKKFLLSNYTDEDIEDYQKLVEDVCKKANSKVYRAKKYEKEMIKIKSLTARRK